jgi:hypothetical protein
LFESETFVDFIEPLVTTDFSDLSLSITALRIARYVWMFQLESNALTLSDFLSVLLALPLIPGSFTLQIGSLFHRFASYPGSQAEQYPFEPVLDRLERILDTVPTEKVITRLSGTIRKLMGLRNCPPPLVVGHPVFLKLWSEIGALPDEGERRNRVELVCLVLDIVESLSPEDGGAVLRVISPLTYAFLLVKCSAETAAVGLTLATRRLAVDQEVVSEFYGVTPIADVTWHFSDLTAPIFLARKWLIFCHALLHRLGREVVSLFLELNMVAAFATHLNGDLKWKAYAIHLISEMISLTDPDPEAQMQVIHAIWNDDNVTDALIANDEDDIPDTFTFSDFGLTVSLVGAAELIRATFPDQGPQWEWK